MTITTAAIDVTAAARRPVPRRWGWRVPGGGRAAHVEPGASFAGTTSQLCGLFPFAVSSGASATIPHRLRGSRRFLLATATAG